jgi:formylglycine-generating enzyme required for sulfatase activity
MHGNVWEWCEDGYGDYPPDGATEAAAAVGSSGARVLCGGGWGLNASNCRSAVRYGSAPGRPFNPIGFRVARTPN